MGPLFAVVALVMGCAAAAAAASPALVPPGGGVKEIPFAKIKYKESAMLVVFYDTEKADPREVSRALQVAMAASRRVGGYEFYKCDTSAVANRALASESKLRGGVHVFSRTVDGGIDEYILPLETKHLVRYLHLRGVVGDPADVVPFTTAEDLAAMWHPLGPRPRAVLVRFHEPWCAYCFRMRRSWEAAASFFRGRVVLADVDCGSGAGARAFCDAQGIETYPVIRLFSAARREDVGDAAWDGTALPEGGAWASDPVASLPSGWREYRAEWRGSRSLAGIEWALHTHRAFLVRDASAQGAAAAPTFDVAGEDAAAVQSIFGLDGREATVRLADYASLPASPDDKDPEALAAALGLAPSAGEALAGAGRTDFVREVRGDGAVDDLSADDDEDEEWGELGDGEAPVVL